MDSPHGEVTCGQKATWSHPGVPDCHRGTGCPLLKDVGVPRQGRPRGSATEKDFRISSLPSPLWLGLFQRSCLPSFSLKPSPLQVRAFSDPDLCLKSQGDFPDTKNKEQTPWHRSRGSRIEPVLFMPTSCPALFLPPAA